MNKFQQRVCKAEYKPDCYILVSATERSTDCGEIRVASNMSFLYDAGKIATEWEPNHGPIQIWYKCNEDDKEAKEHYFFDWHNSLGGNWSQLAVDKNELPRAFLDGDYDYIFNVLKDWTNR